MDCFLILCKTYFILLHSIQIKLLFAIMLFLFLSNILHVVPKFLEAEAEVEAAGVVLLLFGVYYFSIKEIEVDPKDTRAYR